MAIELGIRVDRRGVSLLRDFNKALGETERAGKQAGEKTEKGFKAANREAKNLDISVKELRRGFAALGVGAAFYGLVRLGQSLVKPNRMLEQMGVQFKVLLGSATAAGQRIQEMMRAAEETPFQLDEVIRAGRILEGSRIYSVQMMRDVADAASFAQRPIEELALYFGRLASGDVGRSLERFRELAIATREDFTSRGVEFDKGGQLVSSVSGAMAALVDIVRTRFGGMAKVQMDTLEGMLSNIGDFSFRARAALGSGLFESVKGVAKELLRVGEQLEADGTIERWGKQVGDMIKRNLLPIVEDVANFLLGTLPAAILTLGEAFKELPGIVRSIDWAGLGEDIGKNMANGMKEAVSAPMRQQGDAFMRWSGLGIWSKLFGGGGPAGLATPGAGAGSESRAQALTDALDRLRASFDEMRAKFPTFTFRPQISSAVDTLSNDSLMAPQDSYPQSTFGERPVRNVRDPLGGGSRGPGQRSYNPFKGFGDTIEQEITRGFVNAFDYAESAWAQTLELFLNGTTNIGEMFDGLWQGFKQSALAAVADVIAALMRVAILKSLVSVGGPLGGLAQVALGNADGGPIRPRGYSAGGPVTTGSGSRADDNLTLLSRDEYVINARAARSLGREVLDGLNNGQAPSGGLSVSFNIDGGHPSLVRQIEREIVPALERLVKQNRLNLAGA